MHVVLGVCTILIYNIKFIIYVSMDTINFNHVNKDLNDDEIEKIL